MKQIPYNKIRNEATKEGISVYTKMKQYIRYRKALTIEINNKTVCMKCQHRRLSKFPGEESRSLRCEIVGVNRHQLAKIKRKMVCLYHSKDKGDFNG